MNTNVLEHQTNPYVVDQLAIERAILSFCADGSDALLYAILLGLEQVQTGTSTHNLVHALHVISDDCIKQLDYCLPLVDCDEHIENNECCETKKETLNKIQRHSTTATLLQAFQEGLKKWGHLSNNSHDMNHARESLYRAIRRWSTRLTQLPSWQNDTLRSWFTNDQQQWIITPQSPYWPAQLSDLAIHDKCAPPLCLWGLGDPSALRQCNKPLAIIGSRNGTDYGKGMAYRFAYRAALKGHNVISGGAYGIDASAHWGALKAKDAALARQIPYGRTIAIFAGGLNHMGPASNTQLFQEIIDNHGACISECYPETIPEARRFLTRNRLIAALAKTVICTQARIRSGALNTISWANSLNREVYAIPSEITDPNNAGCNQLIHDGQAIMICSCEDINTIYPQAHHYTAKQDDEHTQKQYNNLPQLQQAIIDCIKRCKQQQLACNIENIHMLLSREYNDHCSIAELSGSLTFLELNGMIRRKHDTIILC